MAPLLRRKRPFCLASPQIPEHASIPFHIEKHPNCDYHACHDIETRAKKWIGQNRMLAIRQLVTIQRLPQASDVSFSDIEKLARISHENVTRPISFYHLNQELYIVYDFLYLDVYDLFPLDDKQVACVMKQTIGGLHHLKCLDIFFEIDTVQINEYGIIKLGVIDWNQDIFSVDGALYKANEEYLVTHLKTLLAAMTQSCVCLPQVASSFLEGITLPGLDHPFISNASGPGILRKPVISAIRKKVLDGGFKPLICDSSIQ